MRFFIDSQTNEIYCGDRILLFDKEISELDGYKFLKKSEITDKRYSVEVSGLEIEGIFIETDRISQTRITQAHALTQLDPSVVVDWKCNGSWMKLEEPLVKKIALSVGKHVQECFTREMKLYGLIEQCQTIEEVQSIHWDLELNI